MKIDWQALKTEYVNGNISYRKLAEKHGLKDGTLRRNATKQGWKQARDAKRLERETMVTQETDKKILERSSEIATLQADSAVRFAMVVNQRLKTGNLDGMELQRLASVWQTIQTMIVNKEESRSLQNNVTITFSSQEMEEYGD